ncbi:putative DD41D transposase [Trichonephila clavipes]|nr:putative DD41D transposase [Trichonephila clavipes]
MGSRPREDLGVIHASENRENGFPGIVCGSEPEYEIAFRNSMIVCRLWRDKTGISLVWGTVQKADPLRLGPHCQVIYSQFGLAIHQNDHQARRRFVEWAQNEIAVDSDFHKQILFSDEAHLWLNGYVNRQNCRIRSEANPQVYVETPLHPEKLTVMGWWNHWSVLLQKR